MTTRSMHWSHHRPHRLPTLLPALLAGVLVAGPTRALDPDRGAAGVQRALRALATTASVLHIVGHPDDEDGATLTALARRHGARTMILSLTRGEGGANLISSDFFDGLGILRTLEYLKAARFYGAELFFTRAVDYGYSKTLDEALKTWDGAETILGDVVRVIRSERPAVVLSRFDGTRRDGHGHHQLAGVLAREALDAAADPDRFPEQLAAGLRPWQVPKLYLPVRGAEGDGAIVEIDSGEYDPLVGASYAQVARHGYGFHRSQGIIGHEGRPGPRVARYRLAACAIDGYRPARESSVFDGLDISITGIARLAGAPPEELIADLRVVEGAIMRAMHSFDPRQPPGVVAHLVDGLRALRRAIDGVSGLLPARDADAVRAALVRKERQLEEAIVGALALHVEVSVGDTSIGGRSPFSSAGTFRAAVPGDAFRVSIGLVNRSAVAVTPLRALVDAPGGAVELELDGRPLGVNESLVSGVEIELPADAPISAQHFRRDSTRDPFYEITDPALLALPLPPPPVHGVVEARVLGERVAVREPLRLTLRDVEHGTRRPALAIVPPISVGFPVAHGVLPIGSDAYAVPVHLRSSVKGEATGTLGLDLPEGWRARPRNVDFAFTREGEEAEFQFVLAPPGGVVEGEAVIGAVAAHAGKEWTLGFETITARDLDVARLFKPARHTVHAVDVRVEPDVRVAYVMGSGDDIPRALGFLGITPELLDADALASGDLSRFDTILIGVRAYAVRDDLIVHNARLLDFVERGGALIVQYQTPEFDRNFGPYPYEMTRRAEEVSEEDARVTILEPEHPVFTSPNLITDADFDDWIEQRGSKFWKSWDDRYTPLLQCHDTGQEPQRGGMLIATYGRGVYVYSAFSWYRQLPHGVPGAFRIFANMVSLGARR